jgi:hypothetical protein
VLSFAGGHRSNLPLVVGSGNDLQNVSERRRADVPPLQRVVRKIPAKAVNSHNAR